MDKRNDGWESGREVYSADQVEAVLREIGIEVKDETHNDLLSYCPFHGNYDSPAFSTSKTYGYSICFNPACGAGSDPLAGPLTLEKLVRQRMGVNHIEAKRLILLKKNTGISFADRFDAVKVEDIELKEFPPAAIDKMHKRFMET